QLTYLFFFFTDTPTTHIYTLSLHDALPISNKLRAKGIDVIALDLTAIGQNITLEQWYNGFLTSLGEQVGLEDELEQYWLANQRRSEEHTSELQSRRDLVCRLLLEKKKNKNK